MADLTPSSGSRLTRRQREQRAYTLGLSAGIGALATVVALVLTFVGVLGFGVVLLLAILTAVAGFAFKRTVS